MYEPREVPAEIRAIKDANRAKMQEMLDNGFEPQYAETEHDTQIRIADAAERIAKALERLAYGIVDEP